MVDFSNTTNKRWPLLLFLGGQKWQDHIKCWQKVNCSAIFKTNPTDRGMCCTFNALAAEEIYRWWLLIMTWILIHDQHDIYLFSCWNIIMQIYILIMKLTINEMTNVFRKSQFSESVANLQKENVRDSFENPPELPEGWERVNSKSNWSWDANFFLGLSYL